MADITQSTGSEGGNSSITIGTTDTDATQGSVFFAGVGGVIQEDNASFFYDNSSNTLIVSEALIGTAAQNATANGLLRIGVSGGSIIDIGPGGTGGSSIWMGTSVTPGSTNYTISASSASTAIQASTNVSINAGSSTKANFSTTTSFTNLTRSGGVLTDYLFRTASATAQTTGTETLAFDFDMSTNGIQHAGSTNYALQRDILKRARTHTGVTATATITDAFTEYIDGAPIAGTNIIITRSWGLGVIGNVQFQTKAYIGAASIAPTAYLHLAASTATANTGQIKFTEGTRQTSAEDGTLNYISNNLEFVENTTVYILAKTLTNTATLNFPDTAGQSSSDLTITVTGAAVGDIVSLGVDNASVNTDSCYTAWVSATDTVTVRFNNYALLNSNPASGNFRVNVTKY